MVPDAKFDASSTPIEWGFDLPSYNFGNSDQLKRLETARIIINDLVGTLNGTVTYRTDLNPYATAWDTFTACAKYEDCCYPQTTTTVGEFLIPNAGNTLEIVVASTSGMSASTPELTIGGFTLTIVSVDLDGVTLTILNSIAKQNQGIVQTGTTVSFCGFDCAGPHTYQPQQRTPIRLSSPPDAEDAISGHFLNRGYEFQPSIALSGSAEIRQIRVFAKDEPDILGMDREEQV